MRYFARVAIERHVTDQYGHVMHCLSRGLAELTEHQYERIMEFDKMDQAERLKVIVAGCDIVVDKPDPLHWGADL